MIRVADYLFRTLADRGVRHVFMVSGGGAMHLNDALGRESRLNYICTHHEQTGAMAAESYARLSGRVGVVNVTTGPGGINALNGVFGAWTDSIPMLVISGQVKRQTCMAFNDVPGLRQLGDQEVDIVRMVKGITKYAEIVREPDAIRIHLEKALHLSTSGRPGPCWIDIPVDVQGAWVEVEKLEGYTPAEDEAGLVGPELDGACREILARLARAKRPVIYAGSGIRTSGGYAAFLELVARLGVPVVTAWNSNDLMPDDHPDCAGRAGSVGDRAGNFAVQNADVLLILGCRLNIRLVSYNWENFARHADKIWVDIDAAELRKPTVRPDFPVHADLREVLPLLLRLSAGYDRNRHDEWRAWCQERRRRFPVVQPEYWTDSVNVNPYCFIERLFDQLTDDEVVVTGDGTACVTAFQAGRVRRGTRMYHNSGAASMGYDVPAAIGAAIALGGEQRVICIAGDGSIMMNLQDLQTIATHKLPVKIFVLNNRGYHSIRQTQQSFFPGNVVGCGEESGLGFPDWGRMAAAFDMPFQRCAAHADLDAGISATLSAPSAAVCEVVLDLRQAFSPKLSSRTLPDGRIVTSPPEDMAPFLTREELRENMIVPILED